MKQILSMLTIAVRSSFYKICLVLAGMSMIEMGIFYHTFLKYDYSQQYQTGNAEYSGEMLGNAFGISWTLESLVEKSGIEKIFLAAFVLICLLLLWAQGERKGVKSHYFYQRLSISIKERFAVWTLYNIGCILLLISVQIFTVLGMGTLFTYLVPAEYESVQMYFMAFYKSEFLHCLVPMAEVWKWIRNLCLFTACSMEVAYVACLKRKPWSLVLLLAMTVFGFSQGIGTYGMEFLMIVVSLICIVMDIRGLRAWELEKYLDSEDKHDI